MVGPSLWRLILLVTVIGLFVFFSGRFGIHPFLVFFCLTLTFGAALPTTGFFACVEDGVHVWARDVGPTILLSVVLGM